MPQQQVIQAEVNKTAAFTGSAIDISSLAGPFDIKIVVDNFTGNYAAFAIETSLDTPTPFATTKVTQALKKITGPLSKDTPMGIQPIHDYDMAGIPNGQANAHLRVTLVEIDSGTISYSAVMSV